MAATDLEVLPQSGVSPCYSRAEALVNPITPYDKLRKLEALIPAIMPEIPAEELTSHYFCEGLYGRRMDLPKGAVLVGKVHKEENFFVLMKGRMVIYTEQGDRVEIKAPFIAVSKPGTKRAGYALTNCTVMNFHANPKNEEDLEQLEHQYVIPEPKAVLPSPAAQLILEHK